MAITAEQKKLLNNATPGLKKAGLGDIIEALQGATGEATADAAGIVKQGVAVDDAAGSTPTKAEFDALLDSLRTAGVIASA